MEETIFDLIIFLFFYHFLITSFFTHAPARES
jgi:hypothetical protein